jgi:hypothetical protein
MAMSVMIKSVDPVAIQLKPLMTVGPLRDPIPCRFKREAKECADGFFVIDDQNGGHDSPSRS